jgi:hypothetical protein
LTHVTHSVNQWFKGHNLAHTRKELTNQQPLRPISRTHLEFTSQNQVFIRLTEVKLKMEVVTVKNIDKIQLIQNAFFTLIIKSK